MLKMSIKEILKRIILVPKTDIIDEQYLAQLAKQYVGKKLYVCDVPIKGVINWERAGNGFHKKVGDVEIYNIDHHFQLDEFERVISSTNLAIDQVINFAEYCDFPNSIAVINHTDCDAILSALVMIGALSPDKKYGIAAIAADHTGEEIDIADLLQGMEYEENLEFSLRNFSLFLEGTRLEEKAQRLFNLRLAERKKAEELFKDGKIKNKKGIYYVRIEERIDPVFFLPFLPEAEILIVFSPGESAKIETRIRKGKNAVIKNLYILEITKFDEEFGCRHNAGSNQRNGGSNKTEKEYVKYVSAKNEQIKKAAK